MSGWGQKQTWVHMRSTSALTLNSDVASQTASLLLTKKVDELPHTNPCHLGGTIVPKISWKAVECLAVPLERNPLLHLEFSRPLLGTKEYII